MHTIRTINGFTPDYSNNIKNPLAQTELGWEIIASHQLESACDLLNLRRVDPGNIFSMSEKILGTVSHWCILGNNVIGVNAWANVPLEEQYHAVQHKAGAFIATAMQYVKVSGRDAGIAIDRLSPRLVSNMPINSLKFVLFTSFSGAVDEEAIIIRTSVTEYIMSCGGGRFPSWLKTIASEYHDAIVEESNILSFNIKGPLRKEAILGMIKPKHTAEVSNLSPFTSCLVQMKIEGTARIARTTIGYEIWSDPHTLAEIWKDMLYHHPLITPCAWQLLNMYRVECQVMIFALYPLDMNSSTTLWEIHYGWMLPAVDTHDYIGREILRKNKYEPSCKLTGLYALQTYDTPSIGSAVLDSEGQFAGYVTTASFSIRDNRILLFAQLLPHLQNNQHYFVGNDRYNLAALPFKPTEFTSLV